jgi:tetratricopeptide (TPR) repeat protein
MPENRTFGAAVCCGLIGLAALIAYHHSFRGPFVFDDAPSIVGNMSLRHLGSVLAPPPGALTVSGRPVLNLSLALNYFVSGTDVWSYHAVNLLIHVLAGLTLFGVVRRTREGLGTGGPPVRAAAGSKAGADGRATRPYLIAFLVALLWTLHPLQTEAVAYVVQRAESQMGLCYLLTLYGFIRYAEARADGGPGRGPWAVLAVVSCFLGMGTKEVMVSAPLMVLLYDRAFVSGSIREAWRRSWKLYAGLAGSWALLGYCVIANGDRGGISAGVDDRAYWLAQFPAILRYLKLAAWPHPLIFDYGVLEAASRPVAVASGLIVGLLIVGTAVALWRNWALGFLGVWFFAILAPTSLIPGNRQTLAEHRMYLPLAAVLAVGVMGGVGLVRRSLLGRPQCLILVAMVAIGLGVTTARRVANYSSNLALWSDTVIKRPENPYAHENLGGALLDQHESITWAKLNSRPANDDPGMARLDAEIIRQVLAQYEAAVRLRPTEATFHFNVGCVLAELGRRSEAAAEFNEALRLDPGNAEAQDQLGHLRERRPSDGSQPLILNPPGAILSFRLP